MSNEDKAKLFALTFDMDLPKKRVEDCDYFWLLRNAPIKNHKHPNFVGLMAFLRKKVGEAMKENR